VSALSPRAARIVERGRQNLRRARAAIASAGPGRTLGDVDLPAEVRFDTTVVRGWALPPGEAVTAVIVSIDGTLQLATVGLTRPDVARARPGNAQAWRSGWEAPLDLRGRIGDVVQVDVSIVTARGLVEHLPPRTARVVGGPILHFDHPRHDGFVRADVVEIIGTALGREAVARVDVVLNGVLKGPARLHAGADVEMTGLRVPGAALSHWSTLLDLRELLPGATAEFDALVTFMSGATERSGSVRARVVAPPALASGPSSERFLASLDAPVASVHPRERTGARRGQVTRVLVVTHDLGLGGGQLWLSELLEQLTDRTDWQFVVVAPRDGPLRSQLVERGCEVHVLSEWPISDPEEYEQTALELRRVAVESGCSAVLVNTMGAGIGADVGVRLGLPVVWAIHESFVFDEFFAAAYPPGATHPIIKESLRRAIGQARAVVFEADATRALYEREGDPRRFVTVRYGVPIAGIDDYVSGSDRDELRRRHGFDADATVVLCMGTFEPRKAQAMLATAFAQIADAHPSSVLVLVGDRDDPYSDATRRHLESLDLGDRIRAVPIVRDPWEWYRMADLLVSASDLESMPRNVIEAMAFGVPVLAADACGVDELVEDGVTGWLCPVRDTRALRDALDRVLSASKADWSAVASAAMAHVRDHHDSAGYGQAFASLLGGVIADGDSFPRDHLGT